MESKMNDNDSYLRPTIENSITFTVDLLNSRSQETIFDTVNRIRNLIIGNNKYKTFFMNDALIRRLIDITNEQLVDSAALKSSVSSDLMNQIIIIFASFSLGNLENIIKLVNNHNLHILLFNIIKQTVTDQTHQNKLNLKLIESSLRCISNLYTTCQLVPSIVYIIDMQLYSPVDKNGLTCLDLFLKVYPMSNLTKRTVIQIVSISSTFLTNILTSSNRYIDEANKSTNRKHVRIVKLNEQIKLNRSTLLKSDCINKFAHLLTSLLEPVQLNVLKFYASICFENIEAVNLLLSCNYYECSLLDLISAYLSRENSAELQLYAAKCITNLCRNIQTLNNSRELESKKNTLKMNRSGYKFKKSYRNKSDECTTSKYDEADFDNEADYEEGDENDENNDNNDDLNEESELELDENEIEFESKTPPTADEISLLNDEYIRADAESIAAARLESLYKQVDTLSPLIRRKTLPTLIRLCSNYSKNYRDINLKSSNLVDLANSSTTSYFYSHRSSSLSTLNAPIQKKETNSHHYYLNIFFLIQSINTLTYLIELSADLQATASFLEQIVPTLAINILEAYSMQEINNIKLAKHKNSLTSHKKVFLKTNTKRQQQFRSLNLDSEKINEIKNNDEHDEANQDTMNAAEEEKFIFDKSRLLMYKGFASLYSMFYLNYDHYTTKSIQFMRNEHQYHKLLDITENHDVLVEANKKSYIKMTTRVNRYLSLLDKTAHKRLASSCFHALGVLASNNEETRRQITDNSSLVCRLVDSIQLKFNEKDSELSEDEASDLNSNKDSNNRLELEDAFKQAEESGNTEKVENILSDLKSEFNDSNFDLTCDSDDNDEDLTNTFDDEFDDYNQTDSDLLRLSGLCLLHSLSRSVHQLRTKFLDKKIWMPIIDLIKRSCKRRLEKKLFALKYKRLMLMQAGVDKKQNLNEKNSAASTDMVVDEETPVQLKDAIKTFEDDIEGKDNKNNDDVFFSDEDSLNEQNLLSVTTAILANLLLEFSPSKEIMEENGIIKILIELVDHRNHSIRVNCMWALMNTAFQADQSIKEQIISTITMEKLFQLLTEQDDTLIMKTLGLIRNLITSRTHIDQIMNAHGTKIIQAIIMILEGEFYNLAIKEQALCILANVADGQSAKEFIMGNEDLLRKINSFMTYNSIELQIASVAAVSNLVYSADDGSVERQTKLKEMGVHRVLQRLLQHNDPLLFDKVKNTLQQFALPSNTTDVSS